MLTWTEAKDDLKKALPNYESRTEQDNLAAALETNFNDNGHILAQAGCGTGKSFVGLVTAARKAKLTHTPALYATATKALQDQISEKDGPFLAANLSENITVTVLKGRGNYVCAAKLSELEDKSLQTQIQSELDENHSGEFDALKTFVAPADRSKLVTTSDECPGKKECPFGDVCFSEKAKAKAAKSDVIVINHAVLAADLAIKAFQEDLGVPADKVTGILPRNFAAVIVDEAHELAEYTTSALGGEITEKSYSRLATEVTKFLDDRATVADLNAKAGILFRAVTKELTKAQEAAKKSGSFYKVSTVRFDDLVLASLAEALTDLSGALKVLRGKVKGATVYGDDKKAQKQKRLVKRLDNAAVKLDALVMADYDDLVRWIESGDFGITIKFAPLSVADFLRDNLWNKAPAALLSATLAVGDDFSFIADQLGLS